jgi:RecA-family ATPase
MSTSVISTDTNPGSNAPVTGSTPRRGACRRQAAITTTPVYPRPKDQQEDNKLSEGESAPQVGVTTGQLPQALETFRDLKRWVNWDYDTETPKKPCTPRTTPRAHKLAAAKNDDPSTWGTYEDAVQSAKDFGCGIGLMLGPNGDGVDIVAFDLDDCRNPDTGELTPWAQELVDQADSYTEVTPSHEGLRIIGCGNIHKVHTTLPRPDGGHKGQVEIYSQATRYITVTGDRLEGTPDKLSDLSDLVLEHKVEREGNNPSTSELTRKTPPASTTSSAEIDLASLQPELIKLIREGVPAPHRSEKFHRAVASLKDRGYSADAITSLLATHPGGIAEKFIERLDEEVERSYGKIDRNTNPQEILPPIDFDPIPIDGSFDPASIIPRQWQIKRLTLLGYITLLISPGGVGKSVLAILIGISVALDRNLIPDRPVRRSGNVLILNSEDDNDEMKRRVAGILHHYEIEPSLLGGKLFIQSLYGQIARLADHDGKAGDVTEGQLVQRIIDYCRKHSIELIIIDPLVGFHDAPENDNNAMEKVVTVLRKVARETGAAVLVIHHSRKSPASSDSQAGDMDSARGASALTAAARFAVTISRMPKTEAAKHDIDWDLGRNLRRIDDAKQNYAPPAEDVSWFEMHSVKIANGEEIGVPVTFDMSTIAERQIEGDAQQLDERLRKKITKTAVIITGDVSEKVEYQRDAIARFIAKEDCGRSKANDHLRVLPVGQDSAFRFTTDGVTRLIWREQVGTEAKPEYKVHWKIAPELALAEGEIGALPEGMA